MSILLIDRSETGRMSLQAFLEGAGHPDILTAGFGEEALDLLGLDYVSGRVDLVLMDLTLAGPDGLETVRRMKTDDRFRHIPVVTVTAPADPVDLEAAFAAGAGDHLTKPLKKPELLARIRAALRSKRELDELRAREAQWMEMRAILERENLELRRLSTLDALTGMPNRRAFDERLAREWRHATHEAIPLGLMMVDVDSFKSYNDTHGHLAGDGSLRRVAEAIRDAIPHPGDLASRYGGEEFAILLPGMPIADMVTLAERLRTAVESLAIPHGASAVSAWITLSIGVASLVPPWGEVSAVLLTAADKALYQAKREGRNRACFAAMAVQARPQPVMAQAARAISR